MTLTQSDKNIEVDIVSDIVCPWCWLGARQFLAATKAVPFAVTLRWHPYMLDSEIPAAGTPYKDYMKAKFGDSPSNKFKAMRAHLENAGPDLGIDFRFDDIPMRPNTLRAHRLMKWAQGQGKATEMAEALFKAFFTDHRDVGGIETLAVIAGEVGMDAALTRDLLQSERDADAVKSEIAYFANLGISGVPTFIYNRQYVVQGAQPTDTHIAHLQKVASLSA